MAGGYSGRGSRRGGGYSGRSGSYAGPPVKRKKDSGRSTGGFLGNLAGDIKDTVVGFPAGIVSTVRHPVRTGEAIAKSYDEGFWGKAVRGEDRAALAEFYDSPLGPLLDLATIVTGGGAAAGKLSTLPAKGVVLRSPRALVREGRIDATAGVKAAQDLTVKGVRDQADTVTGRSLSRNPVIRTRQELVDAVLKSLPPGTPMIGEFARYGRELTKLKRKDALRLERNLIPYQKARAKLDKHERAALDVLVRYPLPRLLAAQVERWKAGDEVAQAFAAAVSHPKVQALYDQPSEKMLVAHKAAESVSKTMAEVLELDPEIVAARPFLHMRLASGGKFEYDEAALKKRGLTREMVAQAESAEGVAPGAFVRAADRDNYGRVLSVSGDSANVHFVNRFEGTEAKVDLPVSALTPVPPRQVLANIPKALEGGDESGALQAELAASGRPSPIYDPDTAAITPSPFSFQRSAGGGKARPRRIGETKQSQGVLAQFGMLALGLDSLSPAYMRSLRFSLYGDLYEGLLASAVRVPKEGAKLREGYEWIRRPKGKSSSESIPNRTKTRAAALAAIEDNLDSTDDLTAFRDAFTSKSLDADVLEQNGFYLQVPSKLAREVTGEFTRSGKVLFWMIQKPTKIWRTLVLNLRPAWLVNNIVGNHLLLALNYFGPRLLASYAHGIRQHGKPDAEFVKLVEEFFPEQAGGTFIDTQLPKGGKTGRVAKVVGGGLAPADRATEAMLRRTAIREELKRKPEVKARLKAMPKERRSFEQASREALEESPHLAREVSDNVNSALGDFLSLGSFEREYVRALFPFYAWYKAITKVALRLPLDHPGRSDILAKLGEVGHEQQDEDYPTSLQGLIGLGDEENGRQRVFDTSRANPFTTITSLGDDVKGSINPFAAGLIRASQGASRYDKVGPADLLTNAARGVKEAGYEGLPQTRLLEALGINMPGYELSKGTPAKPTLYDRGAIEELLRFLGVAGGRISPKRARELKEQE